MEKIQVSNTYSVPGRVAVHAVIMLMKKHKRGFQYGDLARCLVSAGVPRSVKDRRGSPVPAARNAEVAIINRLSGDGQIEFVGRDCTWRWKETK